MPRTSTVPSARLGRIALGAVLAVTCATLAASSPAWAQSAAASAIAWGENYRGELGVIYRNQREPNPVAMEAPAGLSETSAGGGFGLGLYPNGTVIAWGNNPKGQLGDGTRIATWEKGVAYVTVHGLGPAEQVSAAESHAMALERTGVVETWGNDQYGQQGTGASGFARDPGVHETSPNVVKLPEPAIAIASGGGSDFALLRGGEVYAWGLDDEGQLGIAQPEPCANTEMGQTPCSTWPRPVVVDGKPITHVTAIAAGYESTYAILQSGHVLAWGSNAKGQLGDGGETVHSKDTAPTEVRTLTGPLSHVTQVAAGFNHALALLSGGEVVGWGRSEDGELGPGLGESCKRGLEVCFLLAHPIIGVPHARALAAGVHYSLALSEGQVYAWGGNESGQLGDGNVEGEKICETARGPRMCSPEPRLVLERSGTPVRGVVAIAAGNHHAVALTTSRPPAPLITVSTARRSLLLQWLLPDPERIVTHVLEATEAGAEEDEGESESENEGEEAETEVEHESVKPPLGSTAYTFKNLGERPYQVKLRAGGVNRTLVVTP
jgi:alpha-tubulin suppressor-like RCC1 family protein